jgi:hypothetical protein
MNGARLVACPSCLRHVRAREDLCPFCAAAIPAFLRNEPAPRAPTRRLSRAALYALGATSLGLVTACSGSVNGIGNEDASADEFRPEPAYGGGPVSFDATPPEDAGPPEDALPDQIIGPAYGGPVDAEPVDAISPDGGPDAIGPVYGAPPDAEPFDAGEFDADAGGIASYGLPPMH